MKLAVAAAGTADDPTAWKDRVYALVGHIGALLAPSGNPDALELGEWMLQSKAFNGTFVKAEHDSNTKRLMVSFRSETADDGGLDVLRTEPDYTPLGAAMQRRVLEELRPGDECRVFKHIEAVDAKRKVRILAHFDIVRRAGEGPGAPSSAPAEAPSSRQPPPEQALPERPSPGWASEHARPADHPIGGEGPSVAEIQAANRAKLDEARATQEGATEMVAVEQAMYGATRLEQVRIVAMCKSAGIAHYASPTAEQLPKVLEIITNVRESK